MTNLVLSIQIHCGVFLFMISQRMSARVEDSQPRPQQCFDSGADLAHQQFFIETYKRKNLILSFQGSLAKHCLSIGAIAPPTQDALHAHLGHCNTT